MTGQQIYITMVQILELVNSLISELVMSDVIADGKANDPKYEDLIKEAEERHHFLPQNGNVAFASGFDCWSFTLPSFVPKVAKILDMNAKKL